MYLFTFMKCIFGIIFFIYNNLYKTKIFNNKKHILFLLPSFIMVIMYIYFICLVIKQNIFIHLLTVPSTSMDFSFWFSTLNTNIIINVIIIIGSFSWLLYWISCVKVVKIKSIIILNVMTPINMILLYFTTLLQFTH